jgi:hypothetical protein
MTTNKGSLRDVIFNIVKSVCGLKLNNKRISPIGCFNSIIGLHQFFSTSEVLMALMLVKLGFVSKI